MTDTAHAPERHLLGAMLGTYLAKVVSVEDPEHLARVQVRLLTAPEALADATVALWARVAVPFSGGGRGALFLPDKDDEVAVVFAGGDPRQPLVVGGLWNGSARPPELPGGARVDRYVIKARNGSRIAIVEASEVTAQIKLEVPGGVSATLNQAEGGELTLEAAGNTVTLSPEGVTVRAATKVTVNASEVEVSAGQVTVNAAMSSFSGVVRCDVLQTNAVQGVTYTPGAGNVW
ncbi:phage baseplate assembly protein V [Comamonas sp. JC664]|uniref:phage baseplate assembly protein V n=1 Tax=Comamonas sp. JC664 TaxID=2801917 RepID=UPI001749DD98|nr:phage baseplate assembly protein V [Comamonas sp. JC664]GHG84703.1 hypothetical protein GCM10012319_40700 [Comamonas sp. KCTC 72670]